MNRFEHFACGQVFYQYPYNASFEFILELCNDDDKREAYNESLVDTENEEDRLLLCEAYETEWYSNIPSILEGFIHSCELHFKELKGE